MSVGSLTGDRQSFILPKELSLNLSLLKALGLVLIAANPCVVLMGLMNKLDSGGDI